MNLNHLAIFHAVAACNSVTGGAKRLHISQSAVSKQLGDFEQTLGTRLFDRLPRGVRLTESGRLLLEHANRLFAARDAAEQALSDLHQHIRGRLTLGASRTIGAYMLPEHLARFRQNYPGVELTLQVENTQAIENRLLSGKIDLGFTEGLVSGNEQLHYELITQDELVLIAAPDHPAASRGALRVSELQDYPLLMHELGSGTRAVTEAHLIDKGFHPRPAITLGSSEAIKQTVAAGAGLAFLSAVSVRTELRATQLVVIPVHQLRIWRPLHMVRPTHLSPGPTLSAFIDLLAATAAAPQ